MDTGSSFTVFNEDGAHGLAMEPCVGLQRNNYGGCSVSSATGRDVSLWPNPEAAGASGRSRSRLNVACRSYCPAHSGDSREALQRSGERLFLLREAETHDAVVLRR